jgi:hypothetical protein
LVSRRLGIRRGLRKVRRFARGVPRRSAGKSPGGENFVWVFGTIRTGSTWLGSMMGSMKGHALWNEPRVGELFGTFFYERAAHRHENENFIMSLDYKDIWLPAIRSLVLESARARYPRVAERGHLIIKEPSGSIGAPLLMEAFPESRMVLLVRDPRDVVASSLDAAREGSWAYDLKGNQRRREGMDEEEARAKRARRKADRIAVKRAEMYREYVGNSLKAYESHKGPKSLVRYEDLRADTPATMKRIYSELGIQIEESELKRSVEEHSWENIPEEEKGPGKFARKGRSGSWREDLTPKQARKVERITAPLLAEFYPDSADA